MNHTVFFHRPPRWRHSFILRAPLLLIFCAAFFFTVPNAGAQKSSGTVLVRDTEIEEMIKIWAEPVILAADLQPENINIILVSDENLNAFVAGGPNIFLHTGLLNRSESASEITGVIAHELGHIRGGHLIRTRGAMDNASFEALLGTLAGIGAAVLTGEGGVGAAVSSGAQNMAMNRFLSFSRVQESSADQAALHYFEKADLDPGGLISFMKKLEDQELLPASQQEQYVRTHPLTQDRVEALEAGARHNKGQQEPPAWAAMHKRMKAKLTGFLHPERVAWEYNNNDSSLPARYAHAIAAYRQNNVEKALSLTDELIAAEPNNPYFYELKGQMLTEFSRVEEALPYYKKAVDLKPNAALIRAAYGHALIESAGRDQVRLTSAIEQLRRAARDEPRIARTHRLLATAYGRLDQDGQARLHLAEEALLRRHYDQARDHARSAAGTLSEGSPAWLRAQDILKAVEQARKSD